MPEDVDHVWDLMEDIQICMLVIREALALRARPMSAYARRHENAVFFLTDVSHHKDDEVGHSLVVCLVFADIEGEKYVSLTGHAEVINDPAKVKELWSTPARAWWETPDDPNIRVLKVTPDYAEFWDKPSSVANYVAMAASAYAGTAPDPGEHRKVRM